MASDSSRSPSSSSSAIGNDAGKSYIGSFVSLISNYDIRYEGILYHLNVHDSTLCLKNVKSYGTEGRRKEGPEIPPSDSMYEYILFRGSDIKDLQVKSPPAVQSKQEIPSDSTIIQSQCYMAATSSSLAGSGSNYNFAGIAQQMDTPAISSRPLPATQHSPVPLSFSPSTLVGARSLTESPPTTTVALNTFQAASVSGGSSIPMQGNKEALSGISLALNQVVSSPTTMLQKPKHVDLFSSPIMGVVNDNSESVTHVSTLGSNPQYSNFSPLPQAQRCTPDRPSLFPASVQNSNPTDPQILGKVFYETASNCPNQSMPHELPVVASDMGFINPGQLSTSAQSFLGRDQLLQPRQQVFPLMHMENGGRDAMAAVKPTSSDVLSRSSVPLNQAPLLPLLVSAQQPQYPNSSMQFTEEFDFEAMNQKFNKDEVWGYLGKNKRMDRTDLGEETVIEPSFGANTKPAYKKDEFFDTISCNSLSRGERSGRIHFPGRMKQDTETFGNFQRRPQLQPGYGEYIAGHANYGGDYNLGTGYRFYGGRGIGRDTHF